MAVTSGETPQERGSTDSCLPKEIQVIEIPSRKSNTGIASDTKNMVGNIGKGRPFLYRGIGIRASKALLERFDSSWNPSQAAEFGQGLYMTPNITYTAAYATGVMGTV